MQMKPATCCRELKGHSKGIISRSSLARPGRLLERPLLEEPDTAPAGKAETWVAASEPQHHKTTYRKLDLKLRDNIFIHGMGDVLS